jgi:hypothetical protein
MTPEESARYWAAKKAQHQRALDFLAEARPGDTYRIERYALPQTGIPHELSEDADVHEKRVITLYAVHKEHRAALARARYVRKCDKKREVEK